MYEDIAALEELRAALDCLPAERTIHVRLDTSGVPEAAPAAAAGPDTGATRDAFAALDDILGEYEAMQARAGEAAGAEERLAAATRDAAEADIIAAEVERLLADATDARRDADLSAAVAADILAASTDKATQAAAGGGGGGGGGGGWESGVSSAAMSP